MADVFEWGAVCIFLGSGVIEYLVPVGKVCIRAVFACVNQIGRSLSFRISSSEIIDTWNMTITPAGRHSGEFTIDMPSRPYMAVRLVKVK